MSWDESEEITNGEDIIDSREVIARIDYLSDEDYERNEDEDAELVALKALADEASSAPDWEYGETLIRDSYFVTYAQELADDIGAVDANASWPMSHIDWEGAARDLRMDYTSVDFDGVTYWIRA